MSKRAVLVLRLLAAVSSFVLLCSGTAHGAKPKKDPIPQGYEINPYGCLGRYETATKDRTTAQMEIEVERKLNPLFEPEDPRSIRAMKLCVVAMLKSRLGHMDAAEYYLRAIEEQPFEPGYERIEVPIVLRGTALTGHTYRSHRLTQDPIPVAWYKRLLVEGARAPDLPGAWIQFLESLPERS